MNDYRDRNDAVKYDSWYGPFGARPGIERADEEIRSSVIEALQNDRRLDPSTLNVIVENGVVELNGEVESISERLAAEDDAWDTPGIVDLHNNLHIREE